MKNKSRIQLKGDRAYLPLSRTLIIGPQRTATRILPFRVSGDGIRGVISTGQLPGILCSVSLAESGLVRLQIFNATPETKMLSARLQLVAILRLADARFSIEDDEQRVEAADTVLEVPTAKSVEEWTAEFPRVFEEPRFDYDGRAKGLEVSHREVEWRVPFKDIPRANRGVTYGSGAVSEEEAQQTLDQMQRQGVIRRLAPEERAFFSPVLWVRKPSGSVRPTIDLRLLNEYSNTWNNVNPGVQQTLRAVPSQWRVYSVLDLASGFFHLPIDSELQELFAFEYGGKRWTHRVLPMGWSSSPGIFSSRVRSILEDTGAIAYADDILVGGSTWEDHDQRLRCVLQRLDDYGFHLNADKLKLAQGKVGFLGYDIEGGAYSLESYIAKQQERLPTATTRTQLRKMLGVFNVLRPTCPGLSQILEPLQRELSKEASQRKPLLQLQGMVVAIWRYVLKKNSRIMLKPPGPQRWHLRVDWSSSARGYAIWAGEPESGYLLGVGSAKSPSYSSSMLGELRAIVWALKETYELTKGQEIMLQTDSQAARNRITSDPTADHLQDTRIIRMLEWLAANYGGRLTVDYLPAEENVLADLLSRWKDLETERVQALAAQQRIDLEITNKEKQRRIAQAHLGHWGPRKTWQHLKKDGPLWTGAKRDVYEAVYRCPACQRYTGTRESAVWQGLRASTVNDVVSADFFGPVRWKQGKRRFGLILIDGFSRYLQITACAKPNTAAVKRALERWNATLGSSYGSIRTFLTDNGSGFVSKDLEKWLKERHIHHLTSPVYSPWSNGLAERAVGTVKGRVKRMAWDRGRLRVSDVENAVNSAVNDSTGYSPKEIVFGTRRDGSQLNHYEWEEVCEKARLQTEKQRSLTARRWHKKRVSRGPSLALGDRVLLYQPEKRKHALQSPWTGPYTLIGQKGRVLWKLRENASGRSVSNWQHSNRLKKYRSAQGSDVNSGT